MVFVFVKILLFFTNTKELKRERSFVEACKKEWDDTDNDDYKRLLYKQEK